MYEWDEIDLARSAHITFSGKDQGKLAFLAVDADLDVRYGSRDGAACAEFSREGFDDGSAASGRGWAALGGAGRLVGHIFIHKGDDQASSPNASDFFNSLLSDSLSPRAAGAVALAADQLSGSAAIPLNGRYREGFPMPAQRAPGL